MPPSAQPLPPGTLIQNRYQLQKLLGQGGMSRVYLATDLRLNMRVAVKENLQVDSQARDQFSREAQILARLTHQNLPRVMDSFDDAATGRQYLVMDYIEGEDLEAMVTRLGPLPEASAIGWMQQVLAAVEYLHNQQPPVIHRDIKPSNIKITPQGKAVLVDFGIAKTYEGSGLTFTGARAATPGYSPPEQYGMRTDQRSDIYAVGATLYSLVTGQQPPESTLRVANLATLVPPRQLAPRLSPQVERAILVAMDLDATRRWSRAEAFRTALTTPAAPPPVATVQVGPGSLPTRVAAPGRPGEPGPLPHVYSPPSPARVASQVAELPTPPKPAGKSARWLWAIASALVVLVIVMTAIFLATGGQVSGWFVQPTARAVVVTATLTLPPAPTADFGGTQTVLAAHLDATRTSQASSFQGTLTALVPTLADTATPAPSRIPATPTLPPPTATSPPPTLAPSATATSVPHIDSPTPAAPPTIAVANIRLDPADTRRNQHVTFYATLRNTFRVAQQITWSIWVYEEDQRKPTWRSATQTTNLEPGDHELSNQPNDTWCPCGPGGPLNFIVYIKYIAPDGWDSPVPDLNSNPAQKGFTVNP